MIRIAIVGTGNISHAHVEAYLRFPERCKIVALVDIVPEKAQKMKEDYHLTEAEVYDDHQKILSRKDIDLVDVCTPPYVHASISINSLRSGKNVVCEKPMAASLEECDEMLRARDESGKKLAIIAQNRFRQPISNLKKAARQRACGQSAVRIRHIGMVARSLLLRPVVARHMGEGGRRLYAEPRSPPY